MAAKVKANTPIARAKDLVLARCRAEGMQEDRVRRMARMFDELVSECNVRKAGDLADPELPDRWDARCNANYAASTRRDRFITFRAMISRAFRERIVPSPPERRVISHKLPEYRRSKPLDPADVRRLLAWLRDHLRTWQDYRLYGLALTVPIARSQVGRVLHLRAEDLKGGVRLPVPSRVWMGNRLPPNVVVVDPRLPPILAELVRRTRCEWVFPNAGKTGPWVEGAKEMPVLARRHLHRAARAAGVERWQSITFEALARFGRENPGFDYWADTRPESARSHEPPRPALELGREGHPVSVRGVKKCVPTPKERKAIKLLTDAFPGGLDGNDMTKGYESEGWHTILDRFRNKDPELKTAILFPRDRPDDWTAGLYRLAPR